MYADGYKYWLAYKKNKTSYYRCSRYKTQCPGRIVVDDTKIRNATEHNHPPEPDRVIVDKFRKVLTYRATTETTDLYAIYLEEASQRHQDAALLYTFTAAESAMRKARRKQLPHAPDNVRDLENILNTTNTFRIHSGSRRDPFYQTTLTLNDESSCVIFMHLKTIESLNHIDEIHINDAINTDANIRSHHLLIVHAVKNSYNVPILYAICTCKTQAIYAAIFAYIRENLSNFVTPNTIMSDFDPETQLALAYTFPDASIKGFWFNYIDSVLDYMKFIHLQWDKSRSNTASCLRMLMVLPLLPAEYMIPGLNSIRKWAHEKAIFTESIEKLCLYIEHDWLRSIGADKMSIFGLQHGVYNYVQYFNKELCNALNANQQSIWQIIECITHIATRTYMKCNKRQHSNEFKTNKQQKTLETIVKNATQMWCADPIHLRNPLQFLQLSSHCINDNNMEALIVHRTATSSSEYDNTVSGVHSNFGRRYEKLNAFRRTRSFTTKEGKKHCTVSSDHCTVDPVPLIDGDQSTFGSNQLGKSIPTMAGGKISNDPPPLAFYPKTNAKQVKPIIFSSTEPPPLAFYPKTSNK